MGHLLPHTHTHTHKDEHTPLGQDGEASLRMECGQKRGGQPQNSPLERRVQREKGRREGREVRSCGLIVFQAPSLGPGVSQPNKPFLYMSVPPTG